MLLILFYEGQEVSLYPSTIPTIPQRPERRTADIENMDAPHSKGIAPPIEEPMKRPK